MPRGARPDPARVSAASLPIHEARFADLTAAQLYAILRLRTEVFVVEQDCVYNDLDGKDTAPDAWILWMESEGRVAATIRVLGTGDACSIGRVATDPAFRGRGLAAELVRRGITLADGDPITISAQAHLQDWYSGFGFVAYGDEYLEDGIPHRAMRREGSPSA